MSGYYDLARLGASSASSGASAPVVPRVFAIDGAIIFRAVQGLGVSVVAFSAILLFDELVPGTGDYPFCTCHAAAAPFSPIPPSTVLWARPVRVAVFVLFLLIAFFSAARGFRVRDPGTLRRPVPTTIDVAAIALPLAGGPLAPSTQFAIDWATLSVARLAVGCVRFIALFTAICCLFVYRALATSRPPPACVVAVRPVTPRFPFAGCWWTILYPFAMILLLQGLAVILATVRRW